MTKTLADMTPRERAQCRGMWCEDKDGFLFVYKGDHIGRDWLAVCAYPEDVHETYAALDTITLRPDIPRAWNPDGTPPAGKWEHAEHISKGVTTVYLCGKENPTRRRWIGEWEEA